MSDLKAVKVGDVMERQIKTISGLASVQQAIDVMKEYRVRSLVVERRDEDDEYGVIGVSDIAREVIAKNRSAERVSVYEIMSKPVMTIPEDMRIRYAVRLLVRFQISRAIVVDQNRTPIGVATLRDFVYIYASDGLQHA
ncbi:MAG: CBS domain-containing protein [Alphaproteobacteria bacterium]